MAAFDFSFSRYPEAKPHIQVSAAFHKARLILVTFRLSLLITLSVVTIECFNAEFASFILSKYLIYSGNL